MAVEQFCLKWNNFQTSILTAFESLQVTEDLADVTLTCEGASVKAHKLILSACSPYFRSVFKENPCSHPIVILKDVLYSDMIAVLNFMYHGEVLVSKEQLKSFLQTAETLQVSGLNSLPEISHKKKERKRSHPIEEQSSKIIKVPDKPKVVEEIQDNFELVCVDKIKVEDEDMLVASNETETVTTPVSLLEAALESNKEMPSILERSLTSQTIVKSPSHIFQHSGDKHLHIPRKPPDESDDFKKETESYDQQNSNESLTPIEATPHISQLDVQPHHSSQCGNCPHCGKIYSNQSALKYHVRLVHSDFLNLYCCHLCPLTFDFRDVYKKHMVDAHSSRS